MFSLFKSIWNTNNFKIQKAHADAKWEDMSEEDQIMWSRYA